MEIGQRRANKRDETIHGTDEEDASRGETGLFQRGHKETEHGERPTNRRAQAQANRVPKPNRRVREELECEYE